MSDWRTGEKKAVRYDDLVSFVSPMKTAVLERESGLEPPTTCLEGRGSTTELLPLASPFHHTSFRHTGGRHGCRASRSAFDCSSELRTALRVRDL